MVLLSCKGLRKNSIGTRPPPEKKLLLATVLLWCMRLGQTQSVLDLYREKNIFVSASATSTILFENINRPLTSGEFI